MNITLNAAQNIVNTLNSTTSTNTSRINVANIVNALSNIKSTTFATLTQCSKVATASAHRAQNIYKLTVQNVTLCNSNASIYSNAVTREVIASQQAEAFTAMPSNYTMIDNSYSVCALTSNTNKHYLRAIVNRCLQVVYYCANTNTLLSQEEVAKYLTPSASKALLSTSTGTHVQHADVTHSVIARTFSLPNIYSINVNKQTLTA